MRLALIASLAVLASAAPPALAAVPPGFVGVTLDGAGAGLGRAGLTRELDAMRASGVETIRAVWSWHAVQPYVSWEAVPDAERERFRDVAGLPLATARLDELVGLAARRGLRIMPMTLETPSWIVRRVNTPGSPPRALRPYATFMAALVSRYGSDGSFWREHPDVPRRPVRWWQLWNEPHLPPNWAGRSWAHGYAALVRAGARAVHQADPRARVVLAGIASDRLPVWERLDEILAEGAGAEVDMIAAHVFTGTPRNVVRALRRVRGTMRAYGLGRLPLALTEWSWPSGRAARGGTRRGSWETTPRGQALRVARTLGLLGSEQRRLRLRMAVHYTWLSRDAGGDPFAWAGLRRVRRDGRVVAKPALAAFRRVALALRR